MWGRKERVYVNNRKEIVITDYTKLNHSLSNGWGGEVIPYRAGVKVKFIFPLALLVTGVMMKHHPPEEIFIQLEELTKSSEVI